MMRSVGVHADSTGRDRTSFRVAFRRRRVKPRFPCSAVLGFQQLVAPLSELSFRYQIIQCAMGHDFWGSQVAASRDQPHQTMQAA